MAADLLSGCSKRRKLSRVLTGLLLSGLAGNGQAEAAPSAPIYPVFTLLEASADVSSANTDVSVAGSSSHVSAVGAAEGRSTVADEASRSHVAAASSLPVLPGLNQAASRASAPPLIAYEDVSNFAWSAVSATAHASEGGSAIADEPPGAGADQATEQGQSASTTKPASTATGTNFCRSLPQWQARFGNGSSANGTSDLPEMVLEATVNGDKNTVFVHAACLEDGRLAIADDDWHAMQLFAVAPVTLADGRVFRPLLAAKGARYVVDTLAQTIAITLSADAFDGAKIQGRPTLDSAPPRAPWGGYLTYDALATVGARGVTQYGASLTGVMFGPWGLVHADGYVSSDRSNDPHFIRGNTYFQRSSVENMTTLIIGDATGVGGSWSRPIRFTGIQYGRDFATRPDYVTFPMPSLGGSAALPSTVNVLVNNMQRLTTTVPAGPFQITNVPVISGSGQIQMVVTDTLGRQSVVSQNYYADQQLLEKGLTAFSFEAGFERLSFGQKSFDYGRPAGSATFRWGARKWLTLEARGEAESNRGAVGFGLTTQLGKLGGFNAAAGYAWSDTERGLTYNLGFQRTGRWASFSASWSHSDRGYRPFAALPGEIRPRDQFSVGGGLQLGLAGSLTAAYLRQSQWNGPTHEFVIAGWNKSLGSRLTLGMQSNVDLQAKSWQAGLRLSVHMGRHTNASSEVVTDGHSAYADMQISSPNFNRPGFGWGLKGRSDGTNIEGDVSYNAPWARLSAGIARAGNEVDGRVGVAGTIGTMGGDTFASRPITQSFAIVRTGDVGGVPIMRWNQPDGVTNRKGMAMINDILPYENNKISIDPSVLAMDVEVGGTEVNARAWPGAGVLVDLPVKRVRAVMMHLLLPDHSQVPLGATVTFKSGGDTTFVGKRGEAWLTGVRDHNDLSVTWADSTCAVQFDVPKGTAYGTDLGEVICRSGVQ